jgi:hypothetical protein
VSIEFETATARHPYGAKEKEVPADKGPELTSSACIVISNSDVVGSAEDKSTLAHFASPNVSGSITESERRQISPGSELVVLR